MVVFHLFYKGLLLSFSTKPCLDRNILNNNRPVSKFCFISKFIENVVGKQVNDFISQNGSSSVHQSTYMNFHTTKTALLKTKYNLTTSVHSRKAITLALKDPSAALDTIDHSILRDCLNHWFEVDGNMRMRINSYLTNRK